MQPQLYPGYSTSGIVEAIGPEVKHLEPGDPVYHFGGHATHRIEKEADLIELPDTNMLKRAVFLQLGLISLTSVRLSSVTLGTNATVIGQGLIGNLAAQLLKLSGANKVFCIDISKNRLKIVFQSPSTLLFLETMSSMFILSRMGWPSKERSP